jgi:hypothetical protein
MILPHAVACRSACPLYFLCSLSMLVTLAVSAKLHSVLSHLGAMAVLEYGNKLEAYREEQLSGFGGESTLYHTSARYACSPDS